MEVQHLMTWDKKLEILLSLIQSAAIIGGLWLTVVGWRKSYEQTLRAQNENLRNLIWDRAGSELFMSIDTYEKWIFEMIEFMGFFQSAEPLDHRFLLKEHNWVTAFMEILQKKTSPASLYEEWRNKVEYYKPALIDIPETLISDAFEGHGEIIEAVGEFTKMSDEGRPTRAEFLPKLKPLIDRLGSQGVRASDLREAIHNYCMQKTFFIERSGI